MFYKANAVGKIENSKNNLEKVLKIIKNIEVHNS